MRIGILGANGFLGTSVYKVLMNYYDVIPIIRENYLQYIDEFFDIFINMAGNNKNYWANQYPYKDFKASTSLVYESLFDFKSNQYIFMSSIAVYDTNSHYGFNKLLSEEIIKRYSDNYLILRSCATTDKDMQIGIVNDILKNTPLFISGDSKIQFITRDAVSTIIKDLIQVGIRNKTFNLGGEGTVKISDIENLINRPISYQASTTTRHYEMDVSELKNIVSLKTSYDYITDVIL
jgi:dTDP-4-dehydrorhamnose reductase